jgi:hypothetical protein
VVTLARVTTTTDVTTDAVRARLADARLYLCTDARTERGDLEDFLHAALAGGVDVVQLRDKSLDAANELELQATVARVAAQHGALWAVNDRADVASLAGAPVVHMGQGNLPTAAVRTLLGDGPVLGRSTHSRAQAAGIDRARIEAREAVDRPGFDPGKEADPEKDEHENTVYNPENAVVQRKEKENEELAVGPRWTAVYPEAVREWPPRHADLEQVEDADHATLEPV